MTLTDGILFLLILVVVAALAYTEGHFRGRKMVREEWIQSLNRSRPE